MVAIDPCSIFGIIEYGYARLVTLHLIYILHSFIIINNNYIYIYIYNK